MKWIFLVLLVVSARIHEGIAAKTHLRMYQNMIRGQQRAQGGFSFTDNLRAMAQKLVENILPAEFRDDIASVFAETSFKLSLSTSGEVNVQTTGPSAAHNTEFMVDQHGGKLVANGECLSYQSEADQVSPDVLSEMQQTFSKLGLDQQIKDVFSSQGSASSSDERQITFRTPSVDSCQLVPKSSQSSWSSLSSFMGGGKSLKLVLVSTLLMSQAALTGANVFPGSRYIPEMNGVTTSQSYRGLRGLQGGTGSFADLQREMSMYQAPNSIGTIRGHQSIGSSSVGVVKALEDVPEIPRTRVPSGVPTGNPSGKPTGNPSGLPTGNPSGNPTGNPTGKPTGLPTGNPSGKPTGNPSGNPTGNPSGKPTGIPTSEPTGEPSGQVTGVPSSTPTFQITLPEVNPPKARSNDHEPIYESKLVIIIAACVAVLIFLCCIGWMASNLFTGNESLGSHAQRTQVYPDYEIDSSEEDDDVVHSFDTSELLHFVVSQCQPRKFKQKELKVGREVATISVPLDTHTEYLQFSEQVEKIISTVFGKIKNLRPPNMIFQLAIFLNALEGETFVEPLEGEVLQIIQSRFPTFRQLIPIEIQVEAASLVHKEMREESSDELLPGGSDFSVLHFRRDPKGVASALNAILTDSPSSLSEKSKEFLVQLVGMFHLISLHPEVNDDNFSTVVFEFLRAVRPDMLSETHELPRKRPVFKEGVLKRVQRFGEGDANTLRIVHEILNTKCFFDFAEQQFVEDLLDKAKFSDSVIGKITNLFSGIQFRDMSHLLAGDVSDLLLILASLHTKWSPERPLLPTRQPNPVFESSGCRQLGYQANDIEHIADLLDRNQGQIAG